MTAYRALNEQEAIEFASKLPELFAPGAPLACREIGDGNLNLVFHIEDRNSGRSVILKQALPYAKVVGESWPLTLDRARIESEALAVQYRLCPDLVPKVYMYDAGLALTAMEDLSDHVIMRKGLIERQKYPLFAGHIGRFLANTLFFTSDLGMDLQEKKRQAGRFINPELCKITEDLIFDHPYTSADTNDIHSLIRTEAESLWTDTELQLEVARLRTKFLTSGEALLHGDLHTGSIFVTGQSTKVIDPEFAYYGPMGFDIGAVLANLLLNYAGQEAWSPTDSERTEYRAYLLDTVREIWAVFEDTFRGLWHGQLQDRMASVPGYQDIYIARLLQDTAGFAGCKMIRRIVGLAHVADVAGIADPQLRARAERISLGIGTALVKRNRSIGSISEIIAITEEALAAGD